MRILIPGYLAKRLPTPFLTVLLMLAASGPAQAGEAYYLAMFGSQRIPNDPDYSHTFASFVRATWPGDGPCPQQPALQVITISWLPQKLPVRACKLRPECGRNYGLHETISYAIASDERVSLWGPYQIDKELFFRAARQFDLLGSGRVQYKAIDSGYRTSEVSNCIHAVSSLSEGYRLRAASPGWGEMASFAVLKELEPWILDKSRLHPWVGSALGLDVYPIIYRDWTSPSSGAFYGPIYRLFGGERDLRPTYGPPIQ